MSQPEDPEQREVSIDRLSETFARLFAPADDAASPEPAIDEAAPAAEPGLAALENAPLEEDLRDVSPLRILEAMLFVGSPSNEPLPAERAASVMRGVEAEEIHELVRQLNEEYTAHRCPYRIVSEGPGYRLALSDDYRRLRDKFHGRVRQARLSQAAVEVLAIVAYNEPLTAEEVSKLRNTPSSAVLSQLVRRQLLRLERPEQEPRTPRYYTTPRFLSLFGLESLEELPQSQDLD